MKVSELIIRAAGQANDYDPDGASDAEKYGRVSAEKWTEFYNAAQRRLLLVRPDCHYKYIPFELTANETGHLLPTEAVQLIDMPRNLGADGSTPGDPISLSTEQEIKAFDPTWHSMTGETSIEFYAYDKKKPDTVWTYPRVHASTAVNVEIAYSYHFTEVLYADIASTDIEADDLFIDSLLEWMMKCYFEIDTDSAPNFNLSLRYEESFYKGLGIEFKSSLSISPKK